MRDQPALAQAFKRLHGGPGVLVLPNAWDPMSARLFAASGFAALATSSASVAWALGRQDGQNLTRPEMVAAIGRIAAAVEIPVTADLEAGYGADAAAVGETIRMVLEAGAVGVNLEDGSIGGASPLIDVAEHARRIAAARLAAESAGVPLFINGRTDVYLLRVGAPETRFDHAVERARAYLDAGADGVFVPGVRDLATIERLVVAIPGPLNVLVTDGTPPVPTLRAAGVRRLSTGGRPAQAVLGLLRRIGEELSGPGTYDTIFQYAMPFPEVQELFPSPE
ncbi:MAG: isocitrate lyase/phosphoenolpyruvate mutase family protein [Candidatus Dormibacteraceae bacterium]